MKDEKPAVRELTLVLPDSLAREAEANGLLNAQALEAMFRAELRRRRVMGLFEAADRLAEGAAPPLTEAEVETEVQAARAERLNAHQGRR